MDRVAVPQPAFWRTILALTAFSVAGFAFAVAEKMLSLGIALTYPKGLALLVFLGALCVIMLVFLVLTWTHYSEILFHLLSFSERLHGQPWRMIGVLIFLLILPIFTLVIMHPYIGGLIGTSLWMRWMLFWITTLGLMFAFQMASKEGLGISLLVGAIAQAVFYRLAFILPHIHNSPFVPGWSAASRFYDASLFFAQRIYGMDVPLSVLHPSLHLLYALPFAIPSTPIIVHRIWQEMLFWGLTIAVSLIFVRRLKISEKLVYWLTLGWTFLYILQGPLYTHLLMPILLIFIGYNKNNLRRTWGFVLLASAWAGISRINWFPVPGILAAVLYLLETPRTAYRKGIHYLATPVSFFLLGTMTAFGSQRVYIQFSGNGDTAQFYSSFSSSLLWDRMLPNNTYWLGVLPGVLILSLPLWIIFFHSLKLKRLNPLRTIGILGGLAALFAGGLVVSVKIGGGGDLHNLDAYITMLMLVAGYAVFDRIKPDASTSVISSKKVTPVSQPYLNWRWIGLSAFIPIWFGLQVGGPVGFVDVNNAQSTLAEIRQKVEQIASEGDEVLFISQRQLLAFSKINVPLIHNYEKDFLIEMVMSRNIEYLDTFYDDLYHRRFGLIVVEPQVLILVGNDSHFGAENNAWVLKITRPLLCDYEPVATYEAYNLQLLAPRTGPQECP